MSEPLDENGSPAIGAKKTLVNGANGFPPHLSCGQKSWLWIFRGVSLVGALYIVSVCVLAFLDPQQLSECLCWTYLAFIAVLVGIFFDRLILHRVNENKARLMDRSEVEALFVEARTVEPRLVEPEQRPDNLSEKREFTRNEVERLKALGPQGWTEFQVLSLEQMLIDFLKLEDLQAQAKTNLAYLEDYSQDSAYRYDAEQYYRWEERLNTATKLIDDSKDESSTAVIEHDAAAEKLRAELRALLEHIRSYDADWAKGSAVIRNLTMFGAVAVPVVFMMGILPAIYPQELRPLSILNWGFLGISGSLGAVLLHLFKSDRVEVGNTEGKKELLRTVLGSALGFIAGMVIYFMLSGGLIEGGAIVPELENPGLKHVGLSVLWAVVAGFWFEGVFDRLRKSINI